MLKFLDEGTGFKDYILSMGLSRLFGWDRTSLED